jgi:hypothetical protein
VRIGDNSVFAARARPSSSPARPAAACSSTWTPSSLEIERRLEVYEDPTEVAVLGCAVNGIGEASHADFGITGAKNKGHSFTTELLASGVPLQDVQDAMGHADAHDAGVRPQPPQPRPPAHLHHGRATAPQHDGIPKRRRLTTSGDPAGTVPLGNIRPASRTRPAA